MECGKRRVEITRYRHSTATQPTHIGAVSTSVFAAANSTPLLLLPLLLLLLLLLKQQTLLLLRLLLCIMHLLLIQSAEHVGSTQLLQQQYARRTKSIVKR